MGRCCAPRSDRGVASTDRAWTSRSHRMKRTFAILPLVALAMWAMKRYYADATVDELQWILGPTATLVTALTGVPFEWEPGQGFLSRERFFVIAKACAGINFMIAAFGMMALVRGRRVTSCRSAAGVLVMCVLASYSAAVCVNATRIARSEERRVGKEGSSRES